jgi:hypothetical protein
LIAAFESNYSTGSLLESQDSSIDSENVSEGKSEFDDRPVRRSEKRMILSAEAKARTRPLA